MLPHMAPRSYEILAMTPVSWGDVLNRAETAEYDVAIDLYL